MPITVTHAPDARLVSRAGLAAGAGKFAQRQQEIDLRQQQLQQQDRQFYDQMRFKDYQNLLRSRSEGARQKAIGKRQMDLAKFRESQYEQRDERQFHLGIDESYQERFQELQANDRLNQQAQEKMSSIRRKLQEIETQQGLGLQDKLLARRKVFENELESYDWDNNTIPMGEKKGDEIRKGGVIYRTVEENGVLNSVPHRIDPEITIEEQDQLVQAQLGTDPDRDKWNYSFNVGRSGNIEVEREIDPEYQAEMESRLKREEEEAKAAAKLAEQESYRNQIDEYRKKKREWDKEVYDETKDILKGKDIKLGSVTQDSREWQNAHIEAQRRLERFRPEHPGSPPGAEPFDVNQLPPLDPGSGFNVPPAGPPLPGDEPLTEEPPGEPDAGAADPGAELPLPGDELEEPPPEPPSLPTPDEARDALTFGMGFRADFENDAQRKQANTPTPVPAEDGELIDGQLYVAKDKETGGPMYFIYFQGQIEPVQID